MQKEKEYQYAKFDANVINQANDLCFSKSKKSASDSNLMLSVQTEDETWKFDTESEFFADYRKPHIYSYYNKYNDKFDLNVSYYYHSQTTITVKADSRENIERVFEIFEKNYTKSIVKPPEDKIEKADIFIGHGQSQQWRDLKDHLHDKHGYNVIAYETGARAGHTIRDILNDMADQSTFALLVMTGEDETKDGKLNARQNVVHEVGLFQGRLGFNRAIVVLEEQTEEFSNLHGIQQIRYSKNKIKETFGEILATLRREFE